MAFAFAIGTSSLFAINLEKNDPIGKPVGEPHPYFYNISVDPVIFSPEEIYLKGNITLIPNGEIVTQGLNSNIKIEFTELKKIYQEFKNQAVRNYSYSSEADKIMLKE